MSLPVLAILVIAGVALVVAAVHLSGGGARAVLASEAQALARFREDYPEASPEIILLTDDGLAAVLKLGVESGLVASFGDKFLTRWLAQGEASCRRNGSTLIIGLQDYSWRGVTLRLRSEEDADSCREILGIHLKEMAT